MVEQTPPYSARRDTVVAQSAPARRISWGAVIAGAVIALAVQILLAMLGTGIGASTVDPLPGGDVPSAGAFGIGAAVWWGVSSLLALYAGGWVAGRLSAVSLSVDGALHGILTWALAMLATLYLVGSAAGSIMSGAAGVLGTAASATATVGAAAAPQVAQAASAALAKSGITIDSIKREAMQVLSQTGKPELQPAAIEQQASNATGSVKQAATNPIANDQDFASMIERLIAKGKDTASEVDRTAVVNVVMARTGASREEASKRVAGWEATAQEARDKAAQAAEQAKQKAREVADATAKGISRAMLFGFLALALGAGAAWWGGAVGQRRSLIVYETRV